MANIDGKEAVEILCLMELEEKDATVLELSKLFLSQKLQMGDMYGLWDLIFIWSRLYLQVNQSKQMLFEECKAMILSATNMKAVFPFMKLILAEFGKDGREYCLELCGQALQSDRTNDSVTKSLFYKMVAFLLPADLEICRACALLVFFQERTVDSYKNVFLLYNHPDQQYHIDINPVSNNVRFEVLQILKKDLYFDPEFWSILNIETTCLQLMSEKIAKAALCEIMEKEQWMFSYCANGKCPCHTTNNEKSVVTVVTAAKVNDQEMKPTKVISNSVPEEASSKPPGKKRGRKPGSKLQKPDDDCPIRRSFRQLDLAKNRSRHLNNRYQRLISWQAEINPLKRRGRKPKWLLDQIAAMQNSELPQGKKRGRKPKWNRLIDILREPPVSEITVTISYPDNEVHISPNVYTSKISTEIAHLTEKSSNKPQENEASAQMPHCLLEIPLGNYSSCDQKDTLMTEEMGFHQQGLSMIEAFHTYSRPLESSRDSLDDLPSDTDVDLTQNESKYGRGNIEEKPTENAEVTLEETSVEIKSMPILDKQEVAAESVVETVKELTEAMNGNELCIQGTNTKFPEFGPYSPISPAESTCLELEPERVIPNMPEADLAEMPTLTAADTFPAMVSKVENGKNPEEDAPPILTEMTHNPEVTVDTSRKAPVETFSELSPVCTEILEDPTNLSNAQIEAPIADKVPETTKRHQYPVNCNLCNKEVRCIHLRKHALRHLQIEKKCMFCLKLYAGHHKSLVHLEKHIELLKQTKYKVTEIIVENRPKFELPCAEKTAAPTIQNKFKMIKMKLNCTMKNSGFHNYEETSDLRLRTRLIKSFDPATSLKEHKQSVCKIKMGFRKVLMKRSQPADENKKLLRRRLTSKGMYALTPKENFLRTKGNLSLKLNGVTRKKRKCVIDSYGKTKTSVSQEHRGKYAKWAQRLRRKARNVTDSDMDRRTELSVTGERDDQMDKHSRRLGLKCRSETDSVLDENRETSISEENGEKTEKSSPRLKLKLKSETDKEMDGKSETIVSQETEEKTEECSQRLRLKTESEGKTETDGKMEMSIEKPGNKEKKLSLQSLQKLKRMVKTVNDAKRHGKTKENEEKTEKHTERQTRVTSLTCAETSEKAEALVPQENEENATKSAQSQERNLNSVIDAEKKENETSVPQDNKKKMVKSTKSQKNNVKINSDNGKIIKGKIRFNMKRKHEALENEQGTKTSPEVQKETVEVVKTRRVATGRVGDSGNIKDNAFFNATLNEKKKAKSSPAPFQEKKLGASTIIKCPADICTFTAKSSHVLSHVLSQHLSDKKVLVFFYYFARKKCLYCSRSICTPQYFLDHVMSHRGELKFPCCHYGCKERCKSRTELTEHLLNHNPLRATCNFPGCTAQFPCTMLLYKHEKEHYEPDLNFERKSLVHQSELTGRSVQVCQSSTSLLASDKEDPKTSSHDDDGNLLVLNKGLVNYGSKNSNPVNGHCENEEVVPCKTLIMVEDKQPLVIAERQTKQYIRPPPTSYLDEACIRMKKRWKEPQETSKVLGSDSEITPTKQRCPRCFQSFTGEKELQTHKDNCTSLFGFDSDDESAS